MPPPEPLTSRALGLQRGPAFVSGEILVLLQRVVSGLCRFNGAALLSARKYGWIPSGHHEENSLQRGRAFVSAEITKSQLVSPPDFRASTGPRFCQRGNAGPDSQAKSRVAGFNGAALLSARK